MSRLVNFTLGAMLGGLVGSVLALLFAPYSGTALRRQMRESVIDVQKEMRQAATARRAEMEKQLADLRAPRR
jgi:gas vesicle protein